MALDLERVDERVASASRVDFPIVSSLIADIVKSGGKRLRPLLLLLAARSYDYDAERSVTAAAGVELLHTASLVHDDSIDHAALRRGNPTLNTQLSSGAVILIGDFLFAQSAILAAATGSVRVVSIFATTLGDICDGQLRETLDAHRMDQTRAEYERRIYGKTAALFAGAAEMGAVLGGAPESDVQNLRAFGREIGMAFQIVDDVLDLREGTQVLGKPAGNDLRQGVITLPVMEYLQGLPSGSDEYATLERIITGEEMDDAVIDGLIGRIRQSGVLESSEQAARQFVDDARARITAVPSGQSRDYLQDLVLLATDRSA